MQIIDNLLNVVKIEAVKLQLQLSVPAPNQKNDILKGIFVEDFNSTALMEFVRDHIKTLEQIQDVEALTNFKDNLNRKRTELQYEGYGFGETKRKRAAEAYSYVFILRILRQQGL